jgi:hypothetical protein
MKHLAFFAAWLLACALALALAFVRGYSTPIY